MSRRPTLFLARGDSGGARVLKAIDALVSEGKQPTITAVRKHIGSGSYTTIDTVLREWRQQSQERPVSTVAALPGEIVEQVQQWASQLWAIASERASSQLQAEREMMEQARQALEAECLEAIQLADQLAGEMEEQQQRYQELKAEHEAQATLHQHHTDELKTQFAAKRKSVAAANENALSAVKEAYQEVERSLNDRINTLLHELAGKKV